MQRIKLYSQISTSLACLSNEKLKQILADSKPMHAGIGGKSVLISFDDTPVFVKKVPLTDLEPLHLVVDKMDVASELNYHHLTVPLRTN